jgi:spermidine synthase
MTNRILLLACFLSGAASLFYQVLWTRAFSLILGSTVQAASLIFAAFLTGLALGALLFGSLSGRLRNPLRAYVLLELGITVTAVATGLILLHHADALGALLGVGTTRYPLAFLLAVLMILPPTLLMGGTLPVVLTIAQRHDPQLSIVGRFYGWNTFGAAVGTLVCGFFAIRLLGISQSYYCAMTLNLAAAGLCILLLRSTAQPPAVTVHREQHEHTVRTALSERYLFLIAGTSGALVLSLEVIWSRFAGFLLGNRTYAFTLLMFTVLTLLAVGSWLSACLYRASLQRPGSNPYTVFVNLLALSALAIALSAAGGWWLIANQSEFEAQLPHLESYVVLYRFLEALVLLSLPLIFLGALLPLAVAQSKHCADNIGHTTARFYVINAVGIVVGSLGTGFVGIELLGSFGMFKLLVVMLLALAVYTFVIMRASLPRFAAALAIVALAALVVLPDSFPAGLRPGEKLIVESEDKYGVFRLVEMSNGQLRVTNNRSELVYHLGAYSTDFVQQMQGHLGLHFNPAARDALVIGNGYGITAGALAGYDSIEHVDAVEILPSMVDAADLFAPNNFSYHENPKVHVAVDDGRHFLVRQNKQYDIITLNVSDPHMPGGATLFHSDFYEVVKERLKPGGVMIQHVFGSEGATIANTLVTSFPHVRFSQSYSNGYNVVASMQPLDEAASRPMAMLPIAALRQLRRSSGGRPLTIPPLQQYSELPDSMHGDIIASDDFPAVEFSWNPGEKTLFINE